MIPSAGRLAMRSPAAIAVALSLAATSPRAAAAPPEPLRHDLRADVAVTAAAVLGWAGSELAKPALAPERCRWCEPPALDERARAGLVWDAPRRARRASDVLAFGLLPAGAAAHQLLAARGAGDGAEGLVDVLLVAEAAALAADVTQVLKYAGGRRRPHVLHGRTPAGSDPDDHLSFPSGHTSLAFSVVTAAGSISSLRGHDSAPWVWGIGLPLAAGVGWLRVAGDAHWLTDVIGGAVVGAAVGVGVPRLLHGRERAAVGAAQARATPATLGLVLAF